jgi:hypothetical protein
MEIKNDYEAVKVHLLISHTHWKYIHLYDFDKYQSAVLSFKKSKTLNQGFAKEKW